MGATRLATSGLSGPLLAYFDESVQGGIFTVAGCLFSAPQARKLRRSWNRIFELYGGCHTAELVGGNGRFKELRSGDTQAWLLGTAAEALGSRAELLVAITCRVSEAEAVYGTKRPLRIAYIACSSFAMVAMSGYSHHLKRTRQRIAYTFEKGHEGENGADRFFNRIRNDEGLQADLSYATHGFASKSDEPLLQCADYLAWQWGRFKSIRATPDLGALWKQANMKGAVYCRTLGGPVLLRHKKWMADPNAMGWVEGSKGS